MSALGGQGMGFVALLDQQDLAVLDPFDLDLTLLSILQVQTRETLELEFLSHGG